MAYLLQAFMNIVNNYQVNISNVTDGNNRANNMGEGLETFVKEAFSNTFFESDKKSRNKNFEIAFHMKVLKLEYPI